MAKNDFYFFKWYGSRSPSWIFLKIIFGHVTVTECSKSAFVYQSDDFYRAMLCITHYCIIFFIGKIFLYVIATGKIRNSETPFCLNMHHFCKKCNRISVPYMGRYAAEESQLTACNANLRHLFSHSPRWLHSIIITIVIPPITIHSNN